MPKLKVIAGLIDKVVDRVDDFTLDKAEKAEMLQEINKAQIEVNKIEAGSSSFFKSGWRPSVGWVCSFALAYHFVLQPMLSFIFAASGNSVELPIFDMTTLSTVLFGMLGLGGMRSLEKVKRSA